MHAASVHPEPGSNSRLKSFILACLFTISLGIVEILVAYIFRYMLPCTSSLSFFVLSHRCSIFKDHSRFRLFGSLSSPFLRALDYYITSFLICQRFFRKKFRFVKYCYETFQPSLFNTTFCTKKQQFHFTQSPISPPKIFLRPINYGDFNFIGYVLLFFNSHAIIIIMNIFNGSAATEGAVTVGKESIYNEEKTHITHFSGNYDRRALSHAYFRK